jgi:hypothetical protein
MQRTRFDSQGPHIFDSPSPFDLRKEIRLVDGCNKASRTNLLLGIHLFGVILDVVALELNELIESESAQRLSSSRVLPSNPRQILFLSVRFSPKNVGDLLVPGSRIDLQRRCQPRHLQ